VTELQPVGNDERVREAKPKKQQSRGSLPHPQEKGSGGGGGGIWVPPRIGAAGMPFFHYVLCWGSSRGMLDLL
jgi:hypothetical protein